MARPGHRNFWLGYRKWYHLNIDLHCPAVSGCHPTFSRINEIVLHIFPVHQGPIASLYCSCPIPSITFLILEQQNGSSFRIANKSGYKSCSTNQVGHSTTNVAIGIVETNLVAMKCMQLFRGTLHVYSQSKSTIHGFSTSIS